MKSACSKQKYLTSSGISAFRDARFGISIGKTLIDNINPP